MDTKPGPPPGAIALFRLLNPMCAGTREAGNPAGLERGGDDLGVWLPWTVLSAGGPVSDEDRRA